MKYEKAEENIMGDKENLEQALNDTQEMARSKRGRRVLFALVGIGFLAAVVLLAMIRGCL
jgi:type IV secretory pathway component VirB8